MDTLIMENFRCFAGRHEVPLKPLTVLVGENSSGKSSFLAAVRLARDISQWSRPLDFNEEPFLLGAYSQIAFTAGDPTSTTASFSIGLTQRLSSGQHSQFPVAVDARFTGISGQPRFMSRSLSCDGLDLRLDQLGDGRLGIDFRGPRGRWRASIEPERLGAESLSRQYSWHSLVVFMNVNRHPANAVVLAEGTPPDESDIGALMDIAGVQGYDAFHTSRARAFGPVRTQPERTYDPVKRIPDAAGQHIPLFLAQALGNTGKAANEALSHALANFGQAAGLWSALDVRRFGDDGDPFQLIVTIAKAKRNLIDVGYGVSQVLPIIVELITAAPNSTFLIQQPEVHLHPRAQAALASLFARLAKERDIQIIVETHSDHFIDRVRMDVRDGKALSPDEVSLLYFELQKGASKIYPIRFDELGNVLDAPSTYRQFFLKEEMRFLGFPD